MSKVTKEAFDFTNSSGRTIYAQSWRPGGDPKHVIVLIHGLGEHLGRYEDWATRFCDSGAAFYALDTHGHGKTTGRRGHTESFELIFDDIETLVARARRDFPQSKIHLYGHSMGGCLVLGAALRSKLDIHSIITTGPAIRPGFEPPAWKVNLAKLLDKIVPGLTLANELDVNEISSDPSIVAAYKADPLVHSLISVRWYNEWLRWVDRIFAGAKNYKQPVLIVHGADDKLTSPVASAQLAAAMGANVTFHRWPHARHEVHNEPFKADVYSFIWNWITSR